MEVQRPNLKLVPTLERPKLGREIGDAGPRVARFKNNGYSALAESRAILARRRMKLFSGLNLDEANVMWSIAGTHEVSDAIERSGFSTPDFMDLARSARTKIREKYPDIKIGDY